MVSSCRSNRLAAARTQRGSQHVMVLEMLTCNGMWVCRILLNVQHPAVQRRLQLLQFGGRRSDAEQTLRHKTWRLALDLTSLPHTPSKDRKVLTMRRDNWDMKVWFPSGNRGRTNVVPANRRQQLHIMSLNSERWFVSGLLWGNQTVTSTSSDLIKSDFILVSAVYLFTVCVKQWCSVFAVESHLLLHPTFQQHGDTGLDRKGNISPAEC